MKLKTHAEFLDDLRSVMAAYTEAMASCTSHHGKRKAIPLTLRDGMRNLEKLMNLLTIAAEANEYKRWPTISGDERPQERILQSWEVASKNGK